MRVNIDLSSIQAKDTIIAANNRQALAIKKSIPLASGASKTVSYTHLTLPTKA